MAKLLRLTLSKIKYGGDSIGDDIRIEIECLNQVFGMDKKIQNGAEVALNAEIGQFTIDETSPQLSMNIRIIEQDLIFNDVGTKQVKMKVDLRNTSPQTSAYDIPVQELRGLLPGRATAIFTLTVEVRVMPMFHYIPPDTLDGWLLSKKNGVKKPISLPAYLKVRWDRQKSNREYITPLEGALRDIPLSVTLDGHGKSYLLQGDPYTPSASLIYSLSRKTLRVAGKSYLATDAPDVRWEKGFYDVEIPDAPHGGGLLYPEATRGTVWFRIGHDGARYLHTGRHSRGCMTLLEQKRWDDLWAVLITARKGDDRSIGVVEITDYRHHTMS